MINFFVVGVNYRKSSISVRNKFALTTTEIEEIYQTAGRSGRSNFFILSTCNRTEIYATEGSVDRVIDMLKTYTQASRQEIEEYLFVKRDLNAINHIFRVASGLDSQILGDCEIVNQMKKAFALAKKHKCSGGYLEKILNMALQASKAVRTHTTLSDGTTSVSFATIKLIKEYFKESYGNQICLLGLGKIGLITLANLKEYLPHNHITVINRNNEKAADTAAKHLVEFHPFEKQEQAIERADILIVATGANHAIIDSSSLQNSKVKLVIDLAVPSNVNPEVADLESVTLFDVDSLSLRVNQTLQNRQNNIPLALEIIDEHVVELTSWVMRKMEYTVCNSCEVNYKCNILNGHRNWYAEQSACVVAG
nr:glutamyl-tRNA reductase [Saprospiraceae bacterium]